MSVTLVPRASREEDAGGITVRPRRRLLALLMAVPLLTVLVLLLALRSVAAPSLGTRLAVAGPGSDLLLSLSRAMFDLSLAALVGCLLVAAWASGRADASAAAGRLHRAAEAWTGLWALSAVAWAAATASQVTGLSLPATLASRRALGLLLQLPQGKALLLVLAAAVSTAVPLRLARRWSATRAGSSALAVVVLVSVCPLLLTGHAASSSSHYLAGQSVLLHVLAVVPWVGGLLVLATHLRGHEHVLRAVLPSFSALAGACFVVVAASGVLGAWTRLGAELVLWRSQYGALLVTKLLLLVLLGVCGAAHRRWTVRGVLAGRPGAFLRLAAGEVVVMGVGVGLGVVLSRTAPPVGALTRTVPPHASAFATVDRSIDPIGMRSLLVTLRPDAMLVTGVLAVAVAAILWQRRYRDLWCTRRLVVFQLGLVVLLWALCGGLGAYSAALASAQVGQLLVMLLVVPVLLVLGAPRVPPVRLPAVLRSRSEVDGLLAVVALLVCVWSTPLLELTLARPVTHYALALTASLCGLALVGPMLVPGARRQDPAVVLGVLSLVLLAQAAQLGRSSAAVAGGWFVRLDWWWADAASDQQVAAMVLGAFGAAVLAFAGTLLVRERLAPR